MTVIAGATACIVGNADRRAAAAWRWLSSSSATERSSFSPSAANMRVSFAPAQAAGKSFGGESELGSVRSSTSTVATDSSRV